MVDQKERELQHAVQTLTAFARSLQGYPQLHPYLQQVGEMLRQSGYHVSGPYGIEGGRNKLVDSFEFFRETFLTVPNDEERVRVLKPLIHMLRQSGIEMIERSRFAKSQVRGESRDDLFDQLFEITANEGRSLLGRIRLYVIWQALQNVALLVHPTIEVGVYRGGTSAFVARGLRALGAFHSPHYAIDTFSGHRGEDIQEFEYHKPGWFSDVSEADVRAYLAPFTNVTVLRGTFEEVVPNLPDQSYRFAHIDTDLYQPTLQALEYLTMRMVPGGIIIVDDYLAPKCIGVTRAIHEFLERNPSFYAWSFDTEQIVLIKEPVNGTNVVATLNETV